MRPEVNTVERELARIAAAAHGIVTRAEMLAAGITESEIKERVRRGALLREHRGVYRVGHRAPSLEARYLAAVKACGEGAALSGLAAAHLLGLTRGTAPAPEVTAPRQRRVPGVLTRRGARPAAVRDHIPVAPPAWILVEIAGRMPENRLARACHEAGVRYRTTPGDVEAVLARLPNARGAAKLRRVMSGETRVTLSRLESRFLALLRAESLPLPVTNRRAGGRRVDCRWPAQRLTVELDSYRFHGSRHSWEQDRHREREARVRGDDFRRFTWGDVFERPAALIAELRTALTGSKAA